MEGNARRRVVCILLYDGEGRFLLQRRSRDTETLPLYWAFFGGGAGEGETLENALRRETLEELGHELTAPRLVFEQDFRVDDLRGRMHLYAERFRGDKSRLKLGEGMDWGWFLEEETRGLLMIDHDRVALRAAAAFLKIHGVDA